MTAVGAVRKVFGIDRDAVRVEKTPDLREQSFIERIAAAERKRKPMTDERMALGERAERPAVLAADADPVLGSDLEEVDRARFRCGRILQRAQQGPPQAESCAMD